MTTEEVIVQKLRELPPERQREVLEFVQALDRRGSDAPRRSVKGLCADLGGSVTEQEIRQAREEMWGTLPLR